MKRPLIFGAASLAAHLAGGAWLLSASDLGDGDAARTGDPAPLSLAATAAVAEVLDAWESQPDVALVEATVLAPRTDRTPPITTETTPQRTDTASLTIPEQQVDAPQKVDPISPAFHATASQDRLAPRPNVVPQVARPELTGLGTPTPDRPQAVATTPPAPPTTTLAAITPPPERPRQTPAVAASSAFKPAAAQPKKTAKATPADDPGLRAHWATTIRSRLARHHRVPTAAVHAGLQGRVVLRLTVRPDGAISGLAIRQGSGHAILDEAAIANVRRAGRLPAAPEGVTGSMTFDVPLTFRIG